MAETIELSEAIRSILGEEKQKNGDVASRTQDQHKTSISNKTLATNSRVGNPTSLDPYNAPERDTNDKSMKQSNTSKLNFRSPPRKRRHINDVIILRNPRRKSKSPSTATKIGELLLKAKIEATKRKEVSNNRHSAEHSSHRISQNVQISPIEQFPQSWNQEQMKHAAVKSEMSSEIATRVNINKECGTLSQQMLFNTAKRKRADDSLTNITWLRRMSAPELDPQTLHVPKVSDPRHERPPYSYSTLIQFAISTAQSGRMTLREIYNWIEVHFPYFRTAKLGWRNSIRHNLSLHKIFIREPPVGHGQSAFWTLRPGTVVRLPEKTMFVAKNNNSSSSEDNQKKTSKSKSGSKRSIAAEEKKRKEQYILPRPSSQSLALVPVPIFLSTETGAQLVTSPATGEPILSSIPLNLLPDAQLKTLLPPIQEHPGQQKKMVRIAPKATPHEIIERSSNNNLNMQACYPNATFSNTSSLRDSGFSTDGEGTFHDSLISPGVNDLFTSPKNLPIKKRFSPWKGITSSTPHQHSKRTENIRPPDDLPDFSIFDELPSFDSTPSKTPVRRGKRKMTTPSRVAPCPEWLSPIRGLTPFKFGDDFTNLRDDLNVTPPRTGLTPKSKFGHASTPSTSLCTPKRSHRSPALGSLGDFGLSGLTPERISDIQNQSFSKMFGGDLSFEMDSDGFWSIMSP